MSFLEQFVDELEATEQDNEMYWSTYYIPDYYKPLEDFPQ
jgi:hypothetical protein